MIIGLDVGFGRTKVCTEEKCFSFPSWVARHTPSADEEVETVSLFGEEYVVGEDAKYESSLIEISDIKDYLKYLPLFLKYVSQNLSETPEIIITGLPPKYRNYAEKVEKIIEDTEAAGKVIPQGMGIFFDVKGQVSQSEDILIIDIGYNTLDYIMLVKDERKQIGFRKRKSNTIDNFGINRAVLEFRNNLEDSYIKNLSLTRLNEIFINGKGRILNETVDFSKQRERAVNAYAEMVIGRLKTEVGDFIANVETIVIAGGGARFIKGEMIGRPDAFIPEKPEFSQARGYFVFGKTLGEEK
ncbi:ParM/StbA family protein [Desulfurobacterium atlanticum]|uniref:StbA protein n=1 Tax=Desulfurobacterium atlanticum TaxID=240169 RepID=A0A238YR62_9BACT|nr:ParM/StbA family protein [Desulfurobacterium atlanticum]SNR73635.1 StbA protein [Desulfurobacterium atlanticum]